MAGIVAYAVYSRGKLRQRAIAESPVTVSDSRQLAEICGKPHLLFRNTALGAAYGHLTAVPLAAANGPRYPSDLVCDRVYASGQSGLYLQASRRALTTYEAVSFDGDFKILHHFKLSGAPSRTRTSPDGRLAVATVFVTGDSYNTGGFSTRTTIFDLTNNALVGNLEDFAVEKDGQAFKNADFNFWGVTFAKDGDLFYATLATGGTPLLVEGSVAGRKVRVIRDRVECPSLSPDGSRIAFKSRVSENGRRIWQLHTLNLKTKEELVVSETHNVDDQAEWLDSEHLLYALQREEGRGGQSDIWLARADGSGTPTLYVRDASSPCVVQR